MKALTYQGFHNVQVCDRPTPDLQHERDAIIKVTRTAICGSDLHLIHNLVPGLPEGMVMGHECMGIVEAVGRGVTNVRRGDRVVVAFPVACGGCYYCRQKLYSLCDDANPEGENSAILGYGVQYGGLTAGRVHPGALC